MSGEFFAIGKPQWTKACALGLNPAVALLVLARGTGRDNSTTRWSAEAVANCTGMGWRRAAAAIEILEQAKLAEALGERTTRPLRKLAISEDAANMLWLPNALVSGAGSEAPPIMRLRQAQNLEHLQAFIELYGMQDLAGDGGLPRNLIWKQYERERICDTGQFVVWGFREPENGARYCTARGPLARFAKRKNGDGSAWDCLEALERMGLLQTVHYLAEGDSPDAELIHALTGDADADEAREAAWALSTELPGGFRYKAEGFAYVLPVLCHIGAPAVVGVSRLVYRPHTKLTAAWWARHRESCGRASAIYAAIAAGDFQRVASA